MKDKTAAGILALFLGWLGFHRFYLGQVGLGIVYLIFCWFPLIWLIALIDAVVLLSMDQRKFDDKYNRQYQEEYRRDRETDFERRQPGRERPKIDDHWNYPPREAERKRDVQREQNRPASPSSRPNPHKQRGMEKFQDFDYAGAIAEFIKSLELAPQDVATHFNIACAYSLTEDAPKAFQHLDSAVALGFRDFHKIKEHHALAYLRIQASFDSFEENGFRLKKSAGTSTPKGEPDLLASQPNLLDQLKKLGELREKGLLTDLEFEEQKRKILG